jgi:hypothetical protein
LSKQFKVNLVKWYIEAACVFIEAETERQAEDIAWDMSNDGDVCYGECEYLETEVTNTELVATLEHKNSD